jgi:hypothetical protein
MNRKTLLPTKYPMKTTSLIVCTLLTASAIAIAPGCSKSDQAADDIAAIRKIKEKEEAEKAAAIKKGEETQKTRIEALTKQPR